MNQENIDQTESNRLYTEFCDEVDAWVVAANKLWTNKDKTCHDTKNVEMWYETFKELATNVTEKRSEVGIILKKMFDAEEISEMDQFGLKTDSVVLFDGLRRPITDEPFIIKRLDKVSRAVYLVIMANNGTLVLKEALHHIGGVGSEVFREIQNLWSIDKPEDHTDLTGAHMSFLLKKAKLKSSPYTKVKEIGYYTGEIFMEKLTEKLTNNLTIRDICLEIDEMIKKFRSGNEKQREAWIYSFGFKILAKCLKRETSTTYKNIITQFLIKYINNENVSFENTIDSLETMEQNGEVIKRNLKVQGVDLFDSRSPYLDSYYTSEDTGKKRRKRRRNYEVSCYSRLHGDIQ